MQGYSSVWCILFWTSSIQGKSFLILTAIYACKPKNLLLPTVYVCSLASFSKTLVLPERNVPRASSHAAIHFHLFFHFCKKLALPVYRVIYLSIGGCSKWTFSCLLKEDLKQSSHQSQWWAEKIRMDKYSCHWCYSIQSLMKWYSKSCYI